MALRKWFVVGGIVLGLWLLANPESHIPKTLSFVSAVLGPLWRWLGR